MATHSVLVSVADLERAITITGPDALNICATCLVAVAMSRSFGERVTVGQFSATFEDRQRADGSKPIIDLPESAVELINLFDGDRFDDLRAMLPMSFRVPAPEASK